MKRSRVYCFQKQPFRKQDYLLMQYGGYQRKNLLTRVLGKR